MDVYLIRHAHAGSRTAGPHDKYRQLSDKGRERALGIVELLDGIPIARIVSSSATRCVQTVEPLALARGLAIEEDDTLWEGSLLGDVLDLLARHRDRSDGLAHLVACSHGDIIPELVDHLGATGVPIKGHGCEKGSIWILSHDGKRWTGARKIGKKATTLA